MNTRNRLVPLLTLGGLWLFQADTGAAEPLSPEGWNNPGRIFTTARQREQLDRLRQNATIPPAGVPILPPGEADPSTPTLPEVTPATAVPRGPRYLTVEGLVLRDDGPSSVWLNRRNIETAKGFTGENYLLEPTSDPTHGVWIRPVDAPDPFRLLPGQTLDAEEKKILPSHLIPETLRRSAMRGGEPEESTPPQPDPSKPANRPSPSGQQPAQPEPPKPANPPPTPSQKPAGAP
ncbi:MAG: hypothetical protein HQM00_13755 [Magnetococcales bacterium]|nr:hypothetical protein [Magnetococcales bacterium]